MEQPPKPFRFEKGAHRSSEICANFVHDDDHHVVWDWNWQELHEYHLLLQSCSCGRHVYALIHYLDSACSPRSSPFSPYNLELQRHKTTRSRCCVSSPQSPVSVILSLQKYEWVEEKNPRQQNITIAIIVIITQRVGYIRCPEGGLASTKHQSNSVTDHSNLTGEL